ncbi:hypothetical protein M231_05362 [Tremella mesenterica]|uniref:Something about silencing protein 4 domain-containing protein n=1 Tax=Tremella mesenterica TaxID=5217 RepID=A0A4Q1BIA1_TREME|nr:hypothetical protein M231_05362 [Tremella mesenterica]
MGRHTTPPDIAALSAKLFNPSLSLRPKIFTQPSPPSLAGSKLAPPWAEVDERPRWRVRRFRLWDVHVPRLYLCVVDPRKRGHLRRYAPFATPSTPTYRYGVISTHPVFSFPRSVRFPYQNSPNHSPSPEHIQNPKSLSHLASVTPIEPINPANPSTDLPAEDLANRLENLAFVPSIAKKDPQGIHFGPIDESKVESTLPGQWPVEELTQQNNNLIISDESDDKDMDGQWSDYITETTMNQNSLQSEPDPPLTREQKKAIKATRHAEYMRLCNHKFLLDAEHERRFRLGMSALAEDVRKWQEENLIMVAKEGHKDRVRPEWRGQPDLQTLKLYGQMFKDIRKKSESIFHHCAIHHPELDLHPVPGRDKAHKDMQEAERAKAIRKAERDEKRMKRKEDRKSNNTIETSSTSTPTPSLSSSTTTTTFDVPSQNIKTNPVTTNKSLAVPDVSKVTHFTRPQKPVSSPKSTSTSATESPAGSSEKPSSKPADKFPAKPSKKSQPKSYDKSPTRPSDKTQVRKSDEIKSIAGSKQTKEKQISPASQAIQWAEKDDKPIRPDRTVEELKEDLQKLRETIRLLQLQYDQAIAMKGGNKIDHEIGMEVEVEVEEVMRKREKEISVSPSANKWPTGELNMDVDTALGPTVDLTNLEDSRLSTMTNYSDDSTPASDPESGSFPIMNAGEGGIAVPTKRRHMVSRVSTR